MDTVLSRYPRLPSWPKDADSPFQLEEPLLLLTEILKFLGTVALLVTTGLLLLLAG